MLQQPNPDKTPEQKPDLRPGDEISRLLKPGLVNQEPTGEDRVLPPIIPSETEKATEGMPEELRNWLLGASQTSPAFLSTMMVDVTNKIGMYVAYLVVRRLSKVDAFLSHLERMENQIFSNARQLEPRSIREMRSEYTSLNAILENFLEFSRKFASASKDIIRDPERDELLQLVRSLDADSLKVLKDMISKQIKSRADKGTLKKDSENGPEN